MNIYQYIAQNSPNEAYQICQQYGIIEVQDVEQLSEAIAQIVANEGESAFKKILDLHPDKEIILEIYQPQVVEQQTLPPVRPLQFHGSEAVPQNVTFDKNPLTQKYFSAEGGGENKLVNQTNLYILVGAMIVSLAIISIKK